MGNWGWFGAGGIKCWLVGSGYGREGGRLVMGHWRMGDFGRNHPFENLWSFISNMT